MSAELPGSPLATKEGWNAFVSGASLPEPPRLLAPADLERLDADERELYDCARQDYHSELTLIATPDILKITRSGQRLVISNRGKQLGRKGLMVSGPSGTGKSTSITQLGKIHQVDVERRAPRGAGRIPVVYIIVPPDATPKNVAIEIAAFLGLPYSSHENPHFITHSVASVLRKVGCSMILVDEVHRLDLRTRKGAAASDELKYLFDSVSATFVYAGLDLAENGMFTGTRGRQLASRFITLDTTAFGYATDKEKADWRMLVATLEDALRLHRHKPGALVNDAAVPPAPGPPGRHGGKESRVMRVWHLPARQLPVPVRPIAGETIPSYARRLGAANGQPCPSTSRTPGPPAAAASWPHQARLAPTPRYCPAGRRWSATATGAGSAATTSRPSTTCPRRPTSSPPADASPRSWPAAATAPGHGKSSPAHGNSPGASPSTP